MRKIVYLIAVVFALGAMSCTKQDIRPDSSTTSNEPIWRVSGGDCGDEIDDEEDEIDLIVDPTVDPTVTEDASNNGAN